MSFINSCTTVVVALITVAILIPLFIKAFSPATVVIGLIVLVVSYLLGNVDEITPAVEDPGFTDPFVSKLEQY